ncbi:MAG: putative colicin protein, partial [Pseudonocardiales bacterium]|nr:putative colicin protein [Pseudonocardiales bacterium]
MFADTIDKFVNDVGTTRVVGTYRLQPAVLNYNAETKLVVAQSLDGAFICGWRMSEDQLRNVIERGSLGGG